MNLWAEESYINASRGHRFGDAEPYETFTGNEGELFRQYQKEFGRCISKVMIDTAAGKTKTIGWVFLKRVPYSDSPDLYLREVWVTLHDGPPKRTVEHQLHELGRRKP